MTQLKSREALSLETCDREPVHIPGSIQGFGALLATDERLEGITWCSANAGDLLGIAPEEAFRQSVKRLLGAETLHDLSNAFSLSTARSQREPVGSLSLGGGTFELWAHLSDGLPVIELEKSSAAEQEVAPTVPLVRALLSRLQGTADLERCLGDAAIGLRNLTGFDRVMFYRFDAEGDGEVLAEARSAEMEPFLGLRFPKWDIPNQARAIMQRVPLRVIASVNDDGVPLLAADAAAQPLDLTLAILRGTSPIHMEYLRNMGVAASMTLSVLVRGRLWGLIAFHHRTPRVITSEARLAAEVFVQFFSLQMEQRLERLRGQSKERILTYQSELLKSADVARDLKELAQDVADPYCRLLRADGMALVSPQETVMFGSCPDLATTAAVADALLAEEADDHKTALTIREGLVGSAASFGSAAGALALRMAPDSASKLVFFRDEALRSLHWAGAPEKEIVDHADGPRLIPRGSFTAYAQAVKGRCLPWEQEDIEAALEVRTALAQADDALFRRLSHKEERQRSLYIAELNHRVRNILALIRSLSRRAQDSADSLESYARALEQRIAALGTAHDLAANRIASGVSLHTLFRTEMQPFILADQEQFAIRGGDYAVRADLAPMFALVVHELTTNSMKHGALSSGSGRVEIDIDDHRGGVRITWVESGGPATRAPNRRGFGLGLIERAVPYEMDGDSRLEFAPEGLRAELWLPAAAVIRLETQPPASGTPLRTGGRQDQALPQSVLILEDSMVVAMDMTDMLRDLGVGDVRTFPTVSQAQASIEAAVPDFAVLDVSLRSEQSFDVARLLLSKKVPFFFATGYGSDYEMPQDLLTCTVLTKPVDMARFLSTLTKLYTQS